MGSYFTTIFYFFDFSNFSGRFQQYPNSPPDLNSSVDKYKQKIENIKLSIKLKFLELKILIISKNESELKFVIQEIFEFTIVMT